MATKTQAKYTLQFQNSHDLSSHINFNNIEHARQCYKEVRKEGRYTHYTLRIDGEISQKGKIV